VITTRSAAERLEVAAQLVHDAHRRVEGLRVLLHDGVQGAEVGVEQLAGFVRLHVQKVRTGPDNPCHA
jgi:predicted metal-dependent hydrolase